MKELSILLPFRSDEGPRDALFHWIVRFYQRYFPDAEICISSDSERSTLFNKSEAVNQCAANATGKYLLIADADIFYNPVIIEKAIGHLEEHAWVIPYKRIHYLTPKGTEPILQQEVRCSLPKNTEIWRTINATKEEWVGGINLVRKEHFDQIGGFDERFLGYGGEDDAFVLCMNTMFGKYLRMDEEVYHLWHPPLERFDNPNYHQNYALYERYFNASKDKEQMIQLVEQKLRGEQIE